MLDRPVPGTLADFELPRLVRLGPNLYGASFFLMKLLPARHILDTAEQNGELQPGGMIAETTSGTFGLALAMLAQLRGYRLTLVSDPAIDPIFRNRLEDLGAKVEIVPKPARTGGYQKARLDRLQRVLALNPGAFCPQQYANPANPRAYRRVAHQLSWRIGTIDCLIGSVGSGGSMCGTAASLRKQQHDLRVIGVDTPKSVLFGQPDGPRPLRGLGNSVMPPNLDHRIFDDIHWVGAGAAFEATLELHRRQALFCGPTSGASYLVARWWANHQPEMTTVVLLPDEGHRYIDTVYNTTWLTKVKDYDGSLPDAPTTVAQPSSGSEPWSMMSWRRRSLEDVMSAISAERAA